MVGPTLDVCPSEHLELTQYVVRTQRKTLSRLTFPDFLYKFATYSAGCGTALKLKERTPRGSYFWSFLREASNRARYNMRLELDLDSRRRS